MIITDEQTTRKHIEIVNAMHVVLETHKITSDEAISAAVELLGVVLMNVCDDKADIRANLEAAFKDIVGFVDANWTLAQAHRARAGSQTTARRH